MLIKPYKKGFTSGPAPYYAANPPVTFSLAWTAGQVENSGGTTITYPALSFGAADPNRIIAIFIGARMATVNTITSVTIGGVAATLVNAGATTVAQQGGTNGNNSAIYQAAVPSGTSGDVVVTWGAAAARTAVSVYRIITGTPTATNSNHAAATTSPTTVNLTLPAGGSGIAGIFLGNSIAAVSWSNATSDYTAEDSSFTARVGTATVTGSNPAATSAAANQVLSSAAWGP